MTVPDDNPSVRDNPYLALREAKIRRNEARLRELGLVTTASSTTKSRNSSNDKPRPKQATVDSQSTLTAVRRSKRLSNPSGDIKYAEVPEPRHQSLKRPRTIIPPSSKDEALTNSKPYDHKQSPSPKQSTPPAPNSVRSISLCTYRLTIGSTTTIDCEIGQDNLGVLGLPMERPGKEYVIYKSFEVAASLEDRQQLEGARLSFNKYSGVQEWNNCIFLWVNLGANGNTVVNTFLDGGNQITWFGGSKMTDDSPTIEKLIRWGKEASESSSKIILWCRKFDASTKAFSPYTCLGRLSYHHHEAGSRPLAFVWNLLDSDRIANHRDARVRETFQTFIPSE